LAKVRQGDLRSVRWSVQNVFDSDFEQEQVDIVTCTLFTHHFTDSELVGLFCRMQSKARLGIVINDLHRHPLAFHSIRLLTSLFSRSPMVKNDASLSVLRSFSKKDWRNILFQAGITHSHIRWFWAFRWLVLIKF
jgi:2-polyprenyl-3-methyl-5-hydroxy-6-metoxy-1,4-benzoquinol methylase